MTLEEVQQLASQYAVIIGSITACAGLIGLLYKATSVLVLKFQAFQRRKRLRGLLVVPTPDEIAKYSKKTANHISPEERAYEKWLRERKQMVQVIYRRIATRRMLVLAFSIVSLFFLLGGWIAVIALS